MLMIGLHHKLVGDVGGILANKTADWDILTWCMAKTAKIASTAPAAPRR